MYFIRAVLAATFILSVYGAKFTNNGFDNVRVGVDFSLTWTENSGPVGLDLMHGNPDNMQVVKEIGCEY